ncbi:MAG TPA: hypothetical protein VNK43_06910 [Gemmatimonadales bacterium]|nr:hypothetical protein [Gemmatimonadales bacterium]
MPRKHLGLLLGLSFLIPAGCRDEPQAKLASLAETMPGLPLPPAAEVLYRAGSEDALQITFRSRLTAEQIADYYRGVFSRGTWRLVSDARTADGATALYAEREGPPLWVTIRANVGGPGSRIDLAGGKLAKPAADSTGAVGDSGRAAS